MPDESTTGTHEKGVFVDVEGCRAAFLDMENDRVQEFAREKLRSDPSEFRLKTIDGWLYLWLVTWVGTFLSGGCFGFMVGIVAGWWGLIFGAFIGVAYSAAVGLLVVSTVFLIAWMLWLDRYPFALAAVSGGLTGLVCAPTAFILTVPFGIAGGIWAAKRFTASATVEHWGQLDEDSDRKPSSWKSFTLGDLFARMTVTAVLLSVWMVVIRLVFGYFD